jgi:hypothetical protein
MNEHTGLARRYHLHSASVSDFTCQPHTGIVGENQGDIVNLVDGRAKPAQDASATTLPARLFLLYGPGVWMDARTVADLVSLCHSGLYQRPGVVGTEVASGGNGLSQPCLREGRRYRVLRPISPQDSQKLLLLQDGRFAIEGIRNRDLQADWPDPAPNDPNGKRTAGLKGPSVITCAMRVRNADLWILSVCLKEPRQSHSPNRTARFSRLK